MAVQEQAPAKRRFGRGMAEERQLPEPAPLRKLLGPSIILVGVGVASGEYILYPYIASQAGLVFLWAAVVGVAVQFFINMEIERYTLATGETAIGSFQRLWKPWGGILAGGAILATMWPGWMVSAATITTFAVGGGNPTTIALIGLLVIGAVLTASPVVYQTVEKLEFLKVAAVVIFMVIAVFAAIKATAFQDTSNVATSFGTFPSEITLAILVGALAAAGAGGANNLVQSNWIRDKGFGMGRYVPRIVSPITGHEEAAPDAERLSFPLDEENLGRWQRWWKRANLEQFVSFACIATLSIVIFSLIAYSTVYKHPDLPESSGFDFIALEADVLKATVGSWFGTMFLAIGAISLFAAALGIVDYVSRLVADVIYTGYTREKRRLAREQAVLRGRLGDGHIRLRDPARRLRPAARPDHDLDRPRRRDHGRLHVPAAGHEPALPAGADPAARLPAHHPGAGRAAARHLHADRRRQRGRTSCSERSSPPGAVSVAFVERPRRSRSLGARASRCCDATRGGGPAPRRRRGRRPRRAARAPGHGVRRARRRAAGHRALRDARAARRVLPAGPVADPRPRDPTRRSLRSSPRRSSRSRRRATSRRGSRSPACSRSSSGRSCSRAGWRASAS